MKFNEEEEDGCGFDYYFASETSSIFSPFDFDFFTCFSFSLCSLFAAADFPRNSEGFWKISARTRLL